MNARTDFEAHESMSSSPRSCPPCTRNCRQGRACPALLAQADQPRPPRKPIDVIWMLLAFAVVPLCMVGALYLTLSAAGVRWPW